MSANLPQSGVLLVNGNARIVLDIGGEGCHPEAWNLNPSPVRTFGAERGLPIPRLLQGRGDAIPLADKSVDLIIAERTPLPKQTLREILRIAKPHATVQLRHWSPHQRDPHRFALQVLAGTVERQQRVIGRRILQETTIRLG